MYVFIGLRVDLDESGVVIWSEETVIAEMKQELVIVLAKEGDQEAFHELYRTYRLPVYRAAFRLMRFKEDAEDIMHETFIRAFRNIRSFDMNVGTNFGAWINRICVNCAIEHLRKHKNRKPHQLDSLTGPQSEPTEEAAEAALENSMNCKECRNLMVVRIYGRLESAEEQELQTHVRGCGECRLMYNRFEEHTSILAGADPETLPDWEASWLTIEGGAFPERKSERICSTSVIVQ